MKRTLFVAAVVLGFASAASAASLSIASDKATYTIGETITLTLTGNSTSLETTSGVYAAVGYDAALTDTVSSSQQAMTTSFGMNTWTTGALQANEGEVALLNQIFLGGSSNGTPPVTATATLVAAAAGTVTVEFLQITNGGGVLDFFDVDSPAQTDNPLGITFTIVPEPTVASLIGLGLVGLAIGGRRRSS